MTNSLTLPSVPSAETLSGYERLGIVGILLLVLSVSLIVLFFLLRHFAKTGAEISQQHSAFVAKQTEILSGLTSAVNANTASANTLHGRIDRILECPLPKCPAQPRKFTDYRGDKSPA